MIDDQLSVQAALRGAAAALGRFIDALVPRMRGGGRLIYIGAGTSGRLGVLDASECPPTFQSDPDQIVGIIAGGDAALRRSSESKEDDPRGARDELDALALTDRDTLLGIAAGGTTPYVLGALELAKPHAAMTGLLTCALPSFRSLTSDLGPLTSSPLVDHLIVLDTGAELLTGSTRLKAGTATKVALNIITTTLFIQLGKVYSNLMVDLRATNAKLTDRAIRILMTLCPELSRAEAHRLLDAADGQLKIAIVMQRQSMDATEARKALESAAGIVSALLDNA